MTTIFSLPWAVPCALLAFGLGSTSALAQENRAVYLFHGHPGNPKSLEVANRYLRSQSDNLGGIGRWNEIIATDNPEFESNSGVDVNGLQMHLRTFARRANGVNPERSIALGSSYGGLVARRMVEIGGARPEVGGVITHGTPNEGSPIAANIDEVVDFAEDSFEDIAVAFALELVESRRGIVSWYGSRRTVKWTIDKVFDAGVAAIGRMVGSPGTRDLEENSRTLRNLNAAPEDVERMLTWAEETEGDLVYRIIGGMPTTLFSDDFEANDDPAVGVANNLEALARDRQAVWAARRNAAPWWGDWFGGVHYSINEMRQLRNAFGEAVSRFEFMDAEYKNRAGFNVNRAVGDPIPPSCVCYTADERPPSDLGSRTQADCDRAAAQAGCVYSSFSPGRAARVVTDYIPNDGIVPIESQQAFEPNQAFWIAMPRDNHFTSNNSANFLRALNLMFDGRRNEWFTSQ